MANYFPPPPPFTGGQQPHAPRTLSPAIAAVQVDNPPFTDGGPTVISSSVAAVAQPNPWTYTFMGQSQPYDSRQLTPGLPGQSVDNPPFTNPGRRAVLAAIAISQPDPWVYAFEGSWQPYAGKRRSSAIPGQSVDNPPFTYGGPLALKLEAIALNQPGWSYNAWPYAFIGNRQPYAPRLIPAAFGAVAVSPFPFSHRERTATAAVIRAAWNPPPPDWQMQLYATRSKPQRIAPSARGYIIL